MAKKKTRKKALVQPGACQASFIEIFVTVENKCFGVQL